jgi:hypothetical protein
VKCMFVYAYEARRSNANSTQQNTHHVMNQDIEHVYSAQAQRMKPMQNNIKHAHGLSSSLPPIPPPRMCATHDHRPNSLRQHKKRTQHANMSKRIPQVAVLFSIFASPRIHVHMQITFSCLALITKIKIAKTQGDYKRTKETKCKHSEHIRGGERRWCQTLMELTNRILRCAGCISTRCQCRREITRRREGMRRGCTTYEPAATFAGRSCDKENDDENEKDG